MVDIAPQDLTRAALMGAFDPRSLLDPKEGDVAPRLRALARAATEVRVGGAWLWRLTPDAQRAGLARLPAGKERSDLLAGLPTGTEDALGKALRLLLQGGPVAPAFARRRTRPDGGDLPALLSLLQALELLDKAGVRLEGWAADPDLARRLARSTVAADRTAARRQILGGRLRGRRSELAALGAFAAEGQIRMPPLVKPEGGPAIRTGAPPTVVLSGLGGSGKSALLEALRRRLGRDRSILRVVLDLDQPALRAGNRVALTQELLRQIGEQRDDLEQPGEGRGPGLSEIRQTLRGGVAAGSEVTDPGREASAVMASLSALHELLQRETGAAPIRLVLIFDTFEEALMLGSFYVGLIADWIALVGRHKLQPRVILSGRETDTIPQSDLQGLAVQGVLHLGDLGNRAAQGLLRDQFRARKIAEEDLVPQLVEAYGSDPLTLIMLARFAEGLAGEGRDARADLIALVQDGASEARHRLDGEMRQAFLFSRIVNRLPTQDLQAVASPGLVLRQVTPELIREVLAGPCGLKEGLGAAEAKDLFERLEDVVWLVRPVSGPSPRVEHIPELRRRMLPQLMQDPKARMVAEAAVGWFEGRAAEGDPGADLEAIYYRALLDPSSLPGDPDLLRRLEDHLGVFAADLGFARELFRSARGGVVSQATVQSLARGATQRGARDLRRKLQISEGQERVAVEEATGAEGPEDGPMSAAELSVAFAQLKLTRVAAEAPRLARALLDAFPGAVTRLTTSGEMTAEDLQGLSVAALQAATACLAPEVGPGSAAALRDAVRDWLDDPEHRARLKWAFANAPQQSGQLWPARLATVLVLSLADGAALSDLGEALAQGVQGMARLSHSPFAWRSLRLAGPLREGAEVKGIALAYLAHEVMNFVAAEFRDWVGTNVQEPGRQDELLKVFKPFFDSPDRVSIRDHNAVDAMLYREDVTVKTRLPLFGRLPETMPGRLPEFHGAFRVILGGEELAPDLVQAAVAELARRVPWWPRELQPEAFDDAPYSPTLVASLIDTADRCGRLPDLAAALARQAGASADCQRLSALIEAVVSRYRSADAAGRL